MFYYRDEEIKEIETFLNDPNKKAMAVYGRLRTGKTELLLHMLPKMGNSIYYQVSVTDYGLALDDFKLALKSGAEGISSVMDSLSSFKDVFTYLSETLKHDLVIIIDEFPFLAKKTNDIPYEFQWIIDHGLNHMKLILSGSNLSFMKTQISDESAPLYGRFDTIIHVRPFTYSEIKGLFHNAEDALNVYAMTWGVAQYVMFFKGYDSVNEAVDHLFFSRNGRLFQEAQNMLRQELKDITTYTAILRAIGSGEKDAAQIAAKCRMDARGVYTYLNRLIELEIISEVANPLSSKKKDKRYRIRDLFFRFSTTFIESNQSAIISLGKDAREYVLDHAYQEYLGYVYEDLIRDDIYRIAAEKKLGFMPAEVGKWWGNIQENGSWSETEVDVVAYDEANIIVGECKYRTKAVGISELEKLRFKAGQMPVGKRRVIYLLAGRSGFTEELLKEKENVILIENTEIVK